MKPRFVWSRLAPLIPAHPLVSIALHQISFARTVQISEWKGGGVGMVATTDGGPSRHFRVCVRSTERFEEVEIRGGLTGFYLRAKTLPSESKLNRLAYGACFFLLPVYREDGWRDLVFAGF